MAKLISIGKHKFTTFIRNLIHGIAPHGTLLLSMKRTALTVLFILLFLSTGYNQVLTFFKDGLDTLKKHQFTGNIYLGFYFSQDAVQYLYLTSTAAGLYIDAQNTYEISGVINYQGLKERSTYNTGYVIIRANLWRHKFISHRIKTNRLSAEPFAMLQFDENRGINNRWQLGLYAVPNILMKKKIQLSAGIGLLYQFDRYDLLPPDYVDWWSGEEMIKVYNAMHILDPDSTGYAYRNGPRAALFVSMITSLGKNIDLNLLVAYQQPFESSFQGTQLYSVSPDYRRAYPCITIESILNFNILKWLSLNIRYYMQHDRNQLTFYLPYYMYSITMGVNFSI